MTAWVRVRWRSRLARPLRTAISLMRSGRRSLKSITAICARMLAAELRAAATTPFGGVSPLGGGWGTTGGCAPSSLKATLLG